MDMDMDEKTTGLPWLDGPITLHSSREYMCTLPTAAECEYQTGHWRFWYQADHVYALNTVYFMVATIGVFAVARMVTMMAPMERGNSVGARRIVAGLRFLGYRSFRLSPVGWYSPPLGVLLLGCAAIVYFFGEHSLRRRGQSDRLTLQLRNDAGPEAILLAKRGLGWFAAHCHQIWMDGCGSSAIRTVSLL
jgi:hypothetical protein